MAIMSDIATVYPYNPDPFFAGCQATGNEERGVVFPNVEPQDGHVMFLGETAIHEAIAALYDISPDEAKRRLSDEDSPKQVELNAAKKRIASLVRELEHWENLKDALLGVGLITPAFEA